MRHSANVNVDINGKTIRNDALVTRTVLIKCVFLCCLVALTGSGLSYEGRLEVLYNGVWGTVCSNDFSDVDAGVFCNQLGMG